MAERKRIVVAGAAPGQAAVFYRGDQVLCGGWIEKAIRDGGSLDLRSQISNGRLKSEI
jgi:hypothetical protein